MSDVSGDDIFDDKSDGCDSYDEESFCRSEKEGESSEEGRSNGSNDDDDDDSASEKSAESVFEEIVEEATRNDDEDNAKQIQFVGDEDGSDDFDQVVLSQSNLSSLSTSSPSPSKSSRVRPQSARSPMKVLISAVHTGPPASSSGGSVRESSTSVPGKDTTSLSSGSPNDRARAPHPPPPLLVRKSPIHVPNRSRDPSPRPSEGAPTSKGLQLSTSSRGINNVLSSKEQSRRVSSKPSLLPSTARPHSAAARPRIMDRESPLQKLPRHRPLGNYSRSLKMLGVKMPSPTHKVSRTPRSASSQSWQSEGKLHTRVTRRSTSLEDVSRAIPQVKTPATLTSLTVDEAQRATLSQAIYEEWYFKRCRQIKSQKVKAKDLIKEEERKKEQKNKEKEEKVAVAVSEWEERKLEQKKKEREKKKTEARKKTEKEKEQEDKQAKITEAIQAWEAEKIAIAKEKREKKRMEKQEKQEKAREKQAKREEAEMVFKSWKEQKLYEEVEKRRRMKHEELEKKLKVEQDKKEKKQDADMAFAAWKRMKMAEQGENHKKVFQDSEGAKNALLRQQLERSSQALEAYERWLDDVEDRRPIRSYEDARTSILSRARAPWWPGGSRNSLLGC